MNLVETEKKWQKIWEENKLYKFHEENVDKKWYVLEMFSYPSAAKLHVGHWYNYGPSDSYARFKRMQGYEVFQPMGFDAFGLPAENYAIKTGVHPKDSTMKNIATMEETLKEMGATFNWENEVITCTPEYYKWTQWIFLQLYKHGLAYRKEAPVNWCPSCQTVLANEQVVENHCERCGTEVIRKNLTQWFFKITDYSEELLQGLDTLDWPKKTVLMQKHWIGKSTGTEVTFTLTTGEKFNVFTTRVDTLNGVSYVVLAPENELVDKITTPEHKAEVEKYKEDCSKINEIERLSTAREKTGVFTGAYAINPINGDKVPVLVADYVLASYGTGAVMGVAAHDDRDYIFAKKHDLPIVRVIQNPNGNDELPYCEEGIVCNTPGFDGMTTEEAKAAITAKIEKDGNGKLVTNYRLRDWLVSRQRYWGCPIPVVYCDHCGIVPVPEDQLPVELPYNVEFKPDGKSPLAKCDEFVNTVCPVCGRPAKREVDTLDTFVCSSWYYLRYVDPHNDKEAFNKDIVNKMLPVDKYIGGAEHACMHLLYARFFTKALRDMGYLDFDEPFKSLVHQGTILGSDGNKMSKSKGNVISPDTFVKEFGSDVFRMYLMFGFSYVDGGPWNEDGIKAINKYIERVERMYEQAKNYTYVDAPYQKAEKELNYVRNNTIKACTSDMDAFAFNTAIAKIMELTNAMYKYDSLGEVKNRLYEDCLKDLILLLAPITPHFAEEINEICGFFNGSVFNQKYPTYDEKALVLDEVELAVQINSKVKAKIVVPSSVSKEELEKLVLSDEKVQELIQGKTIKKLIAIPNRLINIVLA